MTDARPARGIRAGAIGHTGHGDYGHRLHLAYLGLPGVEMVAIADPDEAGRARAMAEAGAQRGYADYREMLAREKLDVVSVCPRQSFEHAAMIAAAAEAGCQIYVDKPLAPDLNECDRIIEACDRCGVRLAVAHQARYVEPFLTARRMVERGEIGRLVSLRGRGKEDHRGGGEDLLELGVHVMDLMRWFAGDPAWVFGAVTCEGRDVRRADAFESSGRIGLVAGDSVTAMYGFAGGVVGHFESARGDGAGRRWGLSLVGTEGTLLLRFANAPREPERTTLRLSRSSAAPEDRGDFVAVEAPVEPTVPGATPPPDAHMWFNGNRLAVWDLLRAAAENRDPISSGRDSRRAMEMVLGVYASHLEGRRVALPLGPRGHPLARG